MTRQDQRNALFGHIWEVVSQVPRGRVVSYGEVARLAGTPGGARRVAPALRAAPRSLQLPWHRVINAQGGISLPRRSGGWREQRRKLEREGITFQRNRVDMSKYGWLETMKD